MMDDNDVLLHEIWRFEMDVLDEIDRVCRENGLKYSLTYGTMLGAVRHHGFIPWDDDIDIMMPAQDYYKLLEIWGKVASDKVVLQNKMTNWDFSQNFTKFRRNHTTFIQSERERHVSYHTGIFVDVFPGYRVAPGRLRRKVQILASAINLLYARNHTSGANGLTGVIERLLLTLPDSIKMRWYQKTEQYFIKWNAEQDQPWFFPCTIKSAQRQFFPELFESLAEVPFEDRKYLCIKDADRFLTQEYGDYMTPPPEEERTLKHHPIIVDFHHNANEMDDDICNR